MKFIFLLLLNCALRTYEITMNHDLIVTKRTLANWDLTDVLALKEKALQGTVLDMLIGAYDKFCNVIAQLPMLPAPNVEQVSLQFMTATQNYSISLAEANKLLNIPAYDRHKPLVVFATGWQNTIEQSGALQQLWRAFNCRGDVNFVAIDAAHYVDTVYTWSARNAERIGEHIGSALAILYMVSGFRLAHLHLIGHSLGAQIIGEAARQFQRLVGRQLPRLTALDPARPCFRYGQRGLLSVQRGDAKLVVVLHTNIGVLGQRDPIGDIDFYAGGALALQPGCLTVACSHSRAIDYFVESVYPGQQRHFVGQYCESWTALVVQNCTITAEYSNTMGYVVNAQRRGIFYVPIRAQSPYGCDATNNGYHIPKCQQQQQPEPSSWMEGFREWLLGVQVVHM